jgi:hypothetical protein
MSSGGAEDGYRFSSEKMPSDENAIDFYQVLGDNSLMEMFNGKLKFCLPHLSLIQTCIRSYNGTGTPIIIMFYAPMNKGKMEA